MATKSIRLSDGTNTLLPESAQSGTGYQKCADGTLICWGLPNITVAANSTGEISVSLSPTFTANPVLVATPLAHSPSVFSISWEGLSTTGAKLRVANSYSQSLSTTIAWVAIGRWK